MKTDEQLVKETEAATRAISGMVRQLLDDGVENTSMVMALSCALGVMMASAPRHMSAQVEAMVVEQLRQSRDETVAEIVAASH